MAFALLPRRKTLRDAVVFGGILLDLCGVAALGAGLGSGVLPPPLAVGYIVSALGGLGFFAVFLADQMARWWHDKWEAGLPVTLEGLQKEATSLGLQVEDGWQTPGRSWAELKEFVGGSRLVRGESRESLTVAEGAVYRLQGAEGATHDAARAQGAMRRYRSRLVEAQRTHHEAGAEASSTGGALVIDVPLLVVAGVVPFGVEAQCVAEALLVVAGVLALVLGGVLLNHCHKRRVKREREQNEYEAAVAELAQNGLALSCKSELKGDRRAVLAAVAQSGDALQFASGELQGDREVVLAAVGQYGGALQFASEELQGDHEVVLAAVAQHGYALQYASEELKGDREVVPR